MGLGIVIEIRIAFGRCREMVEKKTVMGEFFWGWGERV